MTSSDLTYPPLVAPTLQTGCKADAQPTDVTLAVSAVVEKRPHVRGRSRSPRTPEIGQEEGLADSPAVADDAPPWARLRRRKRIRRSLSLEVRLQSTPRPLARASSVAAGKRCRSLSSSNSSGACSPPPGACVALGLDARLSGKPPTPPPPSRPWRQNRANRGLRRKLLDTWRPGAKQAESNENAQCKQEEDGAVVAPSLLPPPPPPPPLPSVTLAPMLVPPPPPPTKRLPLQPKEVCPRGMGICFQNLVGICPRGAASCSSYHPAWRTAAQVRAFLANIPCKHGAACVMQRRHCLFRHEQPPESAIIPSLAPPRPSVDDSKYSKRERSTSSRSTDSGCTTSSGHANEDCSSLQCAADTKLPMLSITNVKQSLSPLRSKEEDDDVHESRAHAVNNTLPCTIPVAMQSPSPDGKPSETHVPLKEEDNHVVPAFSSLSIAVLPQEESAKEEPPTIVAAQQSPSLDDQSGTSRTIDRSETPQIHSSLKEEERETMPVTCIGGYRPCEPEELSAKAAPADDREQNISGLERELKHQTEIDKNHMSSLAMMFPSQELPKSVKEELPALLIRSEAKSADVLSSDGEGLSSSDGEASPPRVASPSLESGQTATPRSSLLRAASPSLKSERASPLRASSPSLESGEASPPRFGENDLLPGAAWLPKREERGRSSSRVSGRSSVSSGTSMAEYSRSSYSSSVTPSPAPLRRRGRNANARPCRSSYVPPALPSRQFLQQKAEPIPLFETPTFFVVSKPAGWEVGPGEPLGSGVADLEDYLRSGWVEPLRAYLALPRTAWHVVVTPSALASGWALIARGKRARRSLDRIVSSGQMQTLSLALVKGWPDKQRAYAQSEAGILEISMLAKYWRTNEDSWSGTGGVEQFALLVLKASGNACGSERSLLKLAWGSSACGDTDSDGNGTDSAPETQGQIFFHSWGLAMPDPWAGDAGLSIVCPLPADLRRSLASLCCEPEAASIHQLLLSGQATMPPEVTGYALPALPEHAPEVLSTLPAPAPFGTDVWQKEGSCSRRRWIIAFCEQVARRYDEYGLSSSPTGELSIMQIFRRFRGLQEACWGNPRMLLIVLSRKDPTKAFAVDARRNVIRRRTATERLQVFVETYAMNLEPGAKVPVAELLLNGHIRTLLYSADLPKRPIMEAIVPCPFFEIDPSAEQLVMRPVRERLQLVAEQLLTVPDHFIARKFVESHGKVPLAWLLGNYTDMLIGGRRPGQHMPTVAEFAEALQASTLLVVDQGTLLVAPKWEYGEGTTPKSELPCLAESGSQSEQARCESAGHDEALSLCPKQCLQSYRDVLKQPTISEKSKSISQYARRVSRQMVRELSGLINHYFEPFTLQNNRLLLHAAEFDAETGRWQWSMQRVAQEMKRIHTIYLPLSKEMRKELIQQVSLELRSVRLVWTQKSTEEEAYLELTYSPDFRQPVLRPIGAPKWVEDFFLKAREFLPMLPTSAAVVMSYALSGGEVEVGMDRKARTKRRRLVLRQILTYAPDVICLQESEACLTSARSCHGVVAPLESHDVSSAASGATHEEDSLFSTLCEALEREDYEWCAAPAHSRLANAVFWRRSTWKAVSWSASPIGCIVATLERQEQPNWKLCVASTSSLDGQDVAWQIEYLKARLPSPPVPSVLCGSFGLEARALGAMMKRQDLRGFRSAHNEVLGEELPWTTFAVDAHLSTSDGIWIGGGSNALSALAVLGGHTRGPRRYDDGRICRDTFPTNHLPLLAVVERSTPSTVGSALVAARSQSHQN